MAGTGSQQEARHKNLRLAMLLLGVFVLLSVGSAVFIWVQH